MRETGEKQLVQQVIVPPGWNKKKKKKKDYVLAKIKTKNKAKREKIAERLFFNKVLRLKARTSEHVRLWLPARPSTAAADIQQWKTGEELIRRNSSDWGRVHDVLRLLPLPFVRSGGACTFTSPARIVV